MTNFPLPTQYYPQSLAYFAQQHLYCQFSVSSPVINIELSKVSVDKVKLNFKKSLTGKYHAHLIVLKKSQLTIEIFIEKQEGDKDQKEDDYNILAKVEVRPKTPQYKEISNRFEQAMTLNSLARSTGPS
jgi:hypothetical protein